MAGPLLRISGLHVVFPSVVAVNDLSLELYEGDVCGLIGPNGSGKTTTMRAIVGLQRPTVGMIHIGGTDRFENRTYCNRLTGFMPDASPIYPKLRVSDYLDHFARAHQVPDRDRRIIECLELTWLTSKASAACGELSRGMKQRLMLAKTMLHDPRLLVLDEPASGIDPLGRIELRKLILKLRDMGKAILVSSHILTEMDQFCNRVAIMEKGKLVREGHVGQLARLSGRRRMVLRWRNDSPLVEQVLRGSTGVSDLEFQDHAARFHFFGEDNPLDDLLAELVRNEVRVVEWRCLDESLENILLDSGAKELM